MKVKYAIMSADEKFAGCWPEVSRAWRRLGVEPILYFLTDDERAAMPGPGRVIKLPLMPHVPRSIQYVMARFYFLRDYLDDVCMLTDIDMLPLLPFDELADIPDDHYVHVARTEPPKLSRHTKQAVLIKWADYPEFTPPPGAGEVTFRQRMCYHAATGRTFVDVLGMEDASWEAFCQRTKRYFRPHPGDADRAELLWDGDETYLTLAVDSYPDQGRIHRIYRGAHAQVWHQTPEKRRTVDKYFIIDFSLRKLKAGHYYDAHLHPKHFEHVSRRLLDKKPLSKRYRAAAAFFKFLSALNGHVIDRLPAKVCRPLRNLLVKIAAHPKTLAWLSRCCRLRPVEREMLGRGHHNFRLYLWSATALGLPARK